MSADETREGFLRRWSRQKVEARDAPPAPPAEVAREAAAAEEPMPVLPPVDELTMESDFTGFFHPKVSEDVRRSALRKLFSDPHFNVMDGLDTYIDDYSVSVPIPPEMLAGMRQAQRILEWASETEEEATLRRATPPVLPVEDEELAAEAQTEDGSAGAPQAADQSAEVAGIPATEGNSLPSVRSLAEGGCRMAATSPLLAPREDNQLAPGEDTKRTSPMPALGHENQPTPVDQSASGTRDALPIVFARNTVTKQSRESPQRKQSRESLPDPPRLSD